jgi:hypothetical protein
MALVKDYDKAWAERHVEPIEIRVFGRVWELPGELSAEATLNRQRAMIAAAELIDEGRVDADGNLTLGKGERLPSGVAELLKGMTADQAKIDELIGADVWAEWQRIGEETGEPLSGPQLQEILADIEAEHDRRAARLLGDTTPDDDETDAGGGEGNLPARLPQAGSPSPRSSKAGPSSRRTSSGSTRSTSKRRSAR